MRITQRAGGAGAGSFGKHRGKSIGGAAVSRVLACGAKPARAWMSLTHGG
jgi:hypothetical protein